MLHRVRFRLLATLVLLLGVPMLSIVGPADVRAAGASDVQVVNLNYSYFSVSWFTTDKVAGSIQYGTSCSGSMQTASEDSRTPGDGYAHLVTIDSLSGATTYYFKVVSGNVVDDNGGSCFSATTLSTFPAPQAPTTLVGSVGAGPNCSLPDPGVLVTATITTQYGRTSLPFTANPAFTDSSGGYDLVASEAVTASGDAVNPQDGDTVHLTVVASGTSQTTSTAGIQIPPFGVGTIPKVCLPQPLVEVISATPARMVPGGFVSISGGGFGAGPNAPVSIQAGVPITGGTVKKISTTADTDSAGDFTGAKLVIPNDAAAGDILATASQAPFGAIATTDVTILATPTLAVTSQAIQAGGDLSVTGSGFPAVLDLYVQLSDINTAGATEEIGQVVTVDSSGAFSTSLIVPSDAAGGSAVIRTYQGSDAGGPVLATTTATVLAPPATLTPIPTPTDTPTTAPVPVPTATGGVTGITLPAPVQKLIALSRVISPGADLLVEGWGFGAAPHEPVDVDASISVGGASVSVSAVVQPDASGTFLATLSIPPGASPGQIAIDAIQPATGASASTAVTIAAPDQTPGITATPVTAPAAASTDTAPAPASTPIMTVTPVGPVPGMTAIPARPTGIGFARVALWYRYVRVGTWNRIIVQGSVRARQQVVLQVTYPNRRQTTYRGKTASTGTWNHDIPVPAGTMGKHSNQVSVVVVLARGSARAQRVLRFREVRA